MAFIVGFVIGFIVASVGLMAVCLIVAASPDEEELRGNSNGESGAQKIREITKD